MNPRLVAISGPMKGSEYPLTRDPLTFGRAADNHVCLEDEFVSRYHFTVWLKDGRPYLKDGETRNGTWVNGDFHLEKFLEDGDRIKCGSATFIFLELEDSPDLTTIINDERDRNRQMETVRADYSSREEPVIYYRGSTQALAKIPGLINAVTDLDELQVRLLELAFDIVPARRGAILLNGRHVSPEASDFISAIYRERDYDGKTRFPLSGTVLAKVYDTREPSMTNNITPILCLPLIMSGAMRGVLYMEGREEQPIRRGVSVSGLNGFEPEHLHYLKAVCESAVVGLRLSRQWESVRNENQVLKAEIKTDYTIIRKSKVMQDVYERIKMAAASDLPVLITGETGTGKEVTARAIHAMGSRAKNLFVGVNCPAIVEDLFESEFFGHVKGSFTGATEARQGKFELAEGGTLLLDEIGALKLPMQPKLLRVLQEQEVEPVGGNRKIKLDVRVITATNVDLEAAVREGAFRQDLFFRLKGIAIHLPPLRERREDIPLLANHFMQKYGKGGPVTAIAAEALEAMISYDWPGNVRELEYVIQGAVVVAQAAHADDIRPQHLPLEVTRPNAPESTTPANLSSKVDEAAKQIRKAEVRKVWQETSGDAAESARRLGITKRHLYRLLKD